MKKTKDLSKLIALAVLFGGVTLSRPAWAEEPVFDIYFYGNQDYSDVAGGTDLSGVTAGIQLAIVDSSEATITFGGNSFTLDDWQTQGKPGHSGEYTESAIRGIYAESSDISNAVLTISGGIIGNNDPIIIVGGSSDGGDVDSNRVYISGGEITNVSMMYGGLTYSIGGKATDNHISITDGSIVGVEKGMKIYGGYVIDGCAENNTLEIGGGAISNVSMMYGVYGGSNVRSVKNGEFVVTGGTIIGVSTGMNIRGVGSTGCYVDSGMMEISGGTLSNVNEVIGGVASKSSVVNSKTKIISGNIEGTTSGVSILGAYGRGGITENNALEISGGTLSSVSTLGGGLGKGVTNSSTSITGGLIYGTSKGVVLYGGNGMSNLVENNTIEISGTATLTNVAEVYGAKGATSAINNQVSIIKGNVAGIEGADKGVAIYGGRSRGIADNNTVEISGTAILTNVAGVYGGYVANGAINGVTNNSVAIVGKTIEGRTNGMSIYGGYGTGNGSGPIANNIVKIANSTLSNVSSLYGGYHSTGAIDVTNNKLLITGGGITFNNDSVVAGGRSMSSAKNNTVEINQCALENIYRVAGGYSTSVTKVTANNTVIITDGSITAADNGAYIYGGFSAKFDAVSNTASILGGTLNGKVGIYGGYAKEGKSDNNTVIIGNKVNLSGGTVNLYGGSGSSSAGNTLTVYKNNVDGTNGTNVVNTIQKFQKYVFEAPVDMSTALTMLKVNNTALALAATDVITVNLAAVPTGAIGTLTLIDSTKGITDTSNATKKVVRGNNEYAGTFAITSGTGKQKLLQLTSVSGLTKYIDVLPDGMTNNTVVVDSSTTATVNTVQQNLIASDSGKTKWQNVYGGYSEANGAVVSGNSVSVAGNYVEQGVYGGYSLTGDAKNNAVTVSGGTFAGVYGGYSLGGEVSGNTVNIQGGEITGDVYAGKSAGENVTGNTINWSAGTIKGSEIRANNINITGTAAQYLGTAGTMTADGNVVLGDSATFTVGDGTDVSALTFGSGLDDKATSVLQIAENSSVIFQGISTLKGTVSGAGKVVVDGAVTADADKFTQTGGLEVISSRVLTLTGEDATLAQTVSGAGRVVIDGTLNADADKFSQTGGLVVASAKKLTLTGGTLSKDVITNAGTVKLDGATLDGVHVTTGTLEFAQDISLDVTYVAAPTNIVDSKVTLTVTGENKILEQTVSGAGKVVIDGTISADAGRFTQTGGLEVQDTLAFTSRGLNVAAVGEFTQAEGSNVIVAASIIEADSNDPAKAMFTGVDSTTADLNVASGNLTIDGPVTDGQYYVLVAGEAVTNGTLQAADLWKKENIGLDTSNYFLADYDYVTNGNAIAVKVQGATVQEANTSGLAAVQQGALAVSKEFTGEVENHLGMIANPKLAEKDKYGKEIWASYIRTKETTDGMKLGAGIEGNNTAKYSGAVVGVDFYSSKKAIAGMAFGYTKGDVDSYSGTTATKNDAKYYGVSFYDRVTNGNTALIYDIGYIRGNNDVSQYHNGKAMTSDVKTNTYTAGARWETAIETGKSRVVPFAAFRYMRVNNGDYTNSHNTRFEAKNQNLYIPKVGIAWTGDFVAPNSVCTWRPSVEVGYLWNLGDRSANSNVLVGTRITDIGYDVADKSSFYGKAGIELMAKNFTAGVFYRYLKGNAVKNNKWNINVAWSF